MNIINALLETNLLSPISSRFNKRLYEIHDDYRDEYKKYLFDNPKTVMAYNDWINEHIGENFEYNKNERNRLNADNESNTYYTPQEILTKDEYIRERLEKEKHSNFGGKTKRSKRRKSRRTRRYRI